MSSSPLHRGDFVWCAFPEGEHPDIPNQHRHIGYVLTVADPTGAQSEHRAMVAYTTSQPWPLAAQRPDAGVVGRASEALKRKLEAKLKDVLTRHRGSMDVLGPDRPRR